MAIEVKVPSPGESITEVEIGNWLVKDQDYVEKDQDIAEVESDKATLTIVADESGVITIKETEGEMIEVGAVIATIDTDAEAPEKNEEPEKDEKEDTEKVESEEDYKEGEKKKEPEAKAEEEKQDDKQSSDYDKVKVTSVAKEIMKDQNLSIDDVINGLKRIGKKEIEAVSSLPKQGMQQQREASRETEESRMSSLRRKVSARLVSVKNETAMLTTFNEIDMSAIMKLRKHYQNKFVEKYGYKVGFMSFFTKAVAIAAEAFPMVNSQIDGENIVTPKFVDVGIAVSTPKGLMVPVLRNVETKSIPQLEKEIGELAGKARNKKISVEELTGGTFTITNGGIFGSLFSTPIINPPQSAILGMHNIVERPMAVNGEVVIRPMMYVALSYDHRIIDGKDSVQFLMKIKEVIENPELLYSEGKDVNEMLLDI